MSARNEFTYADENADPLALLQDRQPLHRQSQRARRFTFIDTFDWRVYRAGFVLLRDQNCVELLERETLSPVARAAEPTASNLVDHLPTTVRDHLQGVLGIRALLPIAAVQSDETVLALHDGDEKTVARLQILRPVVDHDGSKTALNARLRVVPLRGYAKHAGRLADALRALPGVEALTGSLFEEAVTAVGRRPGDYSSKVAFDLNRDEPAFDAATLICSTLHRTIQANEEGVLTDLDSEFLHDFRVAVRRTRSALKELPDVLATDVESRFREEFRWLGQVTTPTRDFDVYLLQFPEYQRTVGKGADDLEPLRRLLESDRRRALTRLRAALRSRRYRRLQQEWGDVLSAGAASCGGSNATVPIGVLADARISHVARRVLRDGQRIGPETPAEALHDLRKRCKELRYLLEFFSSLYPPASLARLLPALKGLQDNLGEIQDTQVQLQRIEEFAEELLASERAPVATLLAVGRLVAALDEQQQRSRAAFPDRFATFAAGKNRRQLSAMTGQPR